MAEATPADKLFDALNEGSTAIIQRLKTGSERSFRVASTVLEEIERGQRDALELGRVFAKQPLDVAGFASAVFQKAGEAQERAFDLTRQSVDEFATANRETRETVRRVAQASVESTRVALDGARGLFTWTRGALEAAVPGRPASPPPTPTRPRRATEEAA
jgi:hypothetical protein